MGIGSIPLEQCTRITELPCLYTEKNAESLSSKAYFTLETKRSQAGPDHSSSEMQTHVSPAHWPRSNAWLCPQLSLTHLAPCLGLLSANLSSSLDCWMVLHF